MRTRIGFIQSRLATGIAAAAGPGCDVSVVWMDVAGGTVDPGTGALVGGTATTLSGTMRAFAVQEPARTVLRQHQEVQAGDLILDVAATPVISLPPGQAVSGTVPLDSLQQAGVRFGWAGGWYAQADLGDDLASAWAAQAGNLTLHRTILLRKTPNPSD